MLEFGGIASCLLKQRLERCVIVREALSVAIIGERVARLAITWDGCHVHHARGFAAEVLITHGLFKPSTISMTADDTPNFETVDRPTGILTPSQRTFLKNNTDTVGSDVREQRRRIRNRLYNAVLDFSFLVEYCRDTDRDQVLGVSRRDSSKEFLEFRWSLADMIRFIYAGMDSPPDFESALRDGVRNAEGVDLENVETPLFVNVDFDVEYATARGHAETAEHIKEGEWDKVTAADLFAFIRVAKAASVTFDVDVIVEEIDDMKDSLESDVGRERNGGE